jgi:hypothetical protein
MLDALLRNPLLRKAIAVGEEGVGRAVSLLLSRLPTAGDVQDLERRLAELEAVLEGLAAKLERPEGAKPDGEGR